MSQRAFLSFTRRFVLTVKCCRGRQRVCGSWGSSDRGPSQRAARQEMAGSGSSPPARSGRCPSREEPCGFESNNLYHRGEKDVLLACTASHATYPPDVGTTFDAQRPRASKVVPKTTRFPQRRRGARGAARVPHQGDPRRGRRDKPRAAVTGACGCRRSARVARSPLPRAASRRASCARTTRRRA